MAGMQRRSTAFAQKPRHTLVEDGLLFSIGRRKEENNLVEKTGIPVFFK